METNRNRDGDGRTDLFHSFPLKKGSPYFYTQPGKGEHLQPYMTFLKNFGIKQQHFGWHGMLYCHRNMPTCLLLAWLAWQPSVCLHTHYYHASNMAWHVFKTLKSTQCRKARKNLLFFSLPTNPAPINDHGRTLLGQAVSSYAFMSPVILIY